MDIEYIRELIELMEEKELITLEISEKDKAVTLTRHYPTVLPATGTISPAIVQNTAIEPSVNSEPLSDSKTENSPIVGVFYSAPSPNDSPFVQVGQTIKAGDQLGIIEAMKIMNPLEATQSGVVAEILIKNGEVVEFGQAIIRYQN